MSVSQQAGLELLGGFRLRAPSGDPLTLKLRKSEALLAYLACQPARSASREQIANLLWGDYEQPRARQSLRQALLDIKRVFAEVGMAPLHIGREVIALDEDAVTSDAQTFETLVKDGSAQSLAEALGLFHGEFLAGLNIRASDFDGWLRAHRNRFQDLHVRAAADYMALAGDSDPEAAIAAGKRALEQDPTREELHRALIDLYGRRGLQSAAMAQYKQCVAALDRELGIGPDEETVILAERMTRRDSQPPSVGSFEEAPAGTLIAAAEQTADVSAPAAIGRARELAFLEKEIEALSQGLGRIVVLRGETGIGKRHLCQCLMAERVEGAVRVSVRGHDPEAMFPWSDLIGQIHEKASALSEEAVDAEAASALALLQGTGWVEASAARPEGASAEARNAAGALVRFLSRRVTMVMAFDGLHGLSGPDLEEVFLWIRRIANYPVLLLISAPSAAASAAPRFEEQLSHVLKQPHCRQLEVPPLSDEAIDELGRELLTRLGLEPVRAAQLAWIRRVSEGNASAAISLAMDLQGRDGRVPEIETYLPADLQAEIASEVSHLSPSARDLLALLALHGAPAGFALLTQASGLPASDLAARVDELIRADMIEVGEEVAGVRHRRVGYAVLNALSPPRRRALHETMAQACEGLTPRERILQSPHAARHLLGSGEEAKAAAYQLIAADLAFRRGALEEAEDLFGVILDTERGGETPSSPASLPVTLQARLGLVRLAEWRRDFKQSLEGAGAVVQRADGGALRDIKGAAEVCRARALFALGDPESALRAARRAERLAEGWAGAGAWFRPDLFLARRHSYGDQAADLSAAVRKAYRDGREMGLILDVVETLGTLAVLSLDRNPAEATAQLDAARDEAANLANGRVDALLDHLGGVAALAQGDRAGAASLFERACAAAKGAGDVYRFYMVEGERALLADRQDHGPDVPLERVALLESTLGSQRMTIALAGRRTAEGRDDEGRAPLWSAVRTAMRLNDEQGFRAGLDSAAGSGTSGR